MEAAQWAAHHFIAGRWVQADRQVITPVEQVVDAVAKVDVQLQRRVARQKRPQVRGDDPPAELHRQAQAQHTDRFLTAVRDAGIGLVQRLEDASGALVVAPASVD